MRGGNNPLSRRGAASFYRGGSGAGYARMVAKQNLLVVGLASRRAGIGDYLSIKEMGCVITHRILDGQGAFPVAKPGEQGRFVKKNVHTLVMPISRESLSES